MLDSIDQLNPSNIKLEVIIVDDGSSEKVVSFLEDKVYSRFSLKIETNTEIRGAAYSKNHGAEQALGKYLWFLDSDVLIENTALLDNLFELLESNENYISGGITEMINGHKFVVDHHFLRSGVVIKKLRSLEEYTLRKVNILASTSLFLPRKCFENIGGFNISFVRDEDTDLCLALKRAGKIFIQSPNTICHHLFSMEGREKSFDLQFLNYQNYLSGLLESRTALVQTYNKKFLALLPLLDFLSLVEIFWYFLSGKFTARIFIFNDKKSRKEGVYKKYVFSFNVIIKNYLSTFILGLKHLKMGFYVNAKFYALFFSSLKKAPKWIRNLVKKQIAKSNSKKVEINHIEKITLFLTDGCNLACPHCFAVNKDVKIKGLLRKSHYARFFRSLALTEYKLHITGGEPTLHPDFKFIIEQAANLGNCKECTIFTNGTNLEKIIELFDGTNLGDSGGMNINIQLSLDGMNKHHDLFRGKENNFEETIDLINTLHQLKKKKKNLNNIIVNTSINEENKNEIPALIEYLMNKDVLHLFNFTRSKDVLLTNDVWGPISFEKSLNLSARKEIFSSIQKLLWKKSEKNLLNMANKSILKSLILIQEKAVKYTCVAGIKNLTILPNGEIAKCEVLDTKGNLADFDFNLPYFLKSSLNKNYHAKDLGCACLHDCGVSNSIIYNKELLETLI